LVVVVRDRIKGGKGKLGGVVDALRSKSLFLDAMQCNAMKCNGREEKRKANKLQSERR
jgi:hypothetical protein